MAANDSALQALRQFLIDNQLPVSLLGFIQNELAQNYSFDRIVSDLRQTAEYKAAYPENDLRQANGFSWMDEGTIRAYRDQARQISMQYLGYNPTNEEIARSIGNNRDLGELAHRMAVFQDFQRWGPAVQNVLEDELGHKLDDPQKIMDFLDSRVPTPELDKAYEMALLRGQPAKLGLGIRPEDEANILRQHGIDPNSAFAAYGKLAEQLPQATRLMGIDAYINDHSQKFPQGKDALGDTPYGVLFRAIQLGDQGALQQLQQTLARETARFQAGGGVALSGTQGVGLLDPEQRRNG